MNPSLLKKILIGFTSVLIILLVLIIVTAKLLSVPKVKTTAIIPTPTTVKTINLPNQNVTPVTIKLPFIVPTGFIKISSGKAGNGIYTYTYSVANQTYRFQVSPPGEINPEGLDKNVTTDSKEVTYAGGKFMRELWIDQQGNPFYIVAIPEDIDHNPHFFSMQLPKDDPSYVTTFDQIVSSFKQ